LVEVVQQEARLSVVQEVLLVLIQGVLLV